MHWSRTDSPAECVHLPDSGRGDRRILSRRRWVRAAFPLIFFGYFWRKQGDSRRRDLFAAMVCLWWSSINLLSVAIYCADSRAGQLMLLDGSTGQESDGHDWNNLLSRWGLLQHDTVIARWMRMIAWLMCIGSIAVAGWSALQVQRAQQVD